MLQQVIGFQCANIIPKGNTIVVLKALGQDNIDELLKVSEEYKKRKNHFPHPLETLTNISGS